MELLGSRIAFLQFYVICICILPQEYAQISELALHGSRKHFFLHENAKREVFTGIQNIEASKASHVPPASPNRCSSLKCTAPLTFAPRGSPCSCVLPIQVGLQFNISLYRFFPLLSELSNGIASSIPLNRTQVRISGLSATDQKLQKVTVSINLVPSEAILSSSTANSISAMFWNRGISINTSIFGAYEVLYVQYPGLAPFPSPEKPEGVDILSKKKSKNISRMLIIIIVISSIAAFAICTGFLLIFSSKFGYRGRNQLRKAPSETKAYGRAKIFSSEDIKKSTDNFDNSRIIGEGGFGLVYEGSLEDGTKIAVKLLKKDDQGSLEFQSEFEILSRLHHKNIVKLTGICSDEDCKCLVYDLVPNESIESHLHGSNKKNDSLDWSARMKIALGAARGLAYLHEDSVPPVIHRDFKASNILLEHDFTPKISDFGLSTTAKDEGAKFAPVMGTFGYLAPEYAMTGNLLIKSDVYSYGVVLLELLTGRKPLDFSQPQGQENLVTWARPLLITKQGIDSMIDPFLRSNLHLKNFHKVAKIASICIQPEPYDRPSMGEVVQELQLIMDELRLKKIHVWRSCSENELSLDLESRLSSEEDLERCVSPFDNKLLVSSRDLESLSSRFWRRESTSLREFHHLGQGLWSQGKFWPSFRTVYQ